MKIWLAFLLWMPLANSAHAEKKTPESADTVIATWPVFRSAALQAAKAKQHLQPQDPQAALALANAYLADAALPGQSRLYGLAQAALEPLITKGTEDPAVWLTWAQILQHQHAFSDAQSALAKVIRQQPENVTAHLLAARIHLIQDDASAARSACLRLLGRADLLTTSACALEASSLQGELADSYKQLSQLVERLGLPEDERGPWILQILADMALRLDQPAAAEQWLSRQELNGASVNYLAQWADVQLQLNQPERVLNQLQPTVDSATDVDDSLLLRLALAEKSVGGNKWQQQLQRRMALREQREDSQHASELAIYYLEINPDAEKALHWAQMNWQSAREHSDKRLLERAQAMADKREKDIQP